MNAMPAAATGSRNRPDGRMWSRWNDSDQRHHQHHQRSVVTAMSKLDIYLQQLRDKRHERVERDRETWSDSWYPIAVNKVRSMALLGDDWNCDGAKQPNAIAIEKAETVLAALKQSSMIPACIDPSVEDGICIEFRSGDRYADIECFNDGLVLAIAGSECWNVEDIGIMESIQRIDEWV